MNGVYELIVFETNAFKRLQNEVIEQYYSHILKTF